jgi:hypothetical protein
MDRRMKCECSDEELEIEDLEIEDNSFTHHFGTEYDYQVVCPNCQAPMGEFASVQDVIDSRSEWYY